MSPKPTLGETKIRAGRLNETPEAARMILLLQVHQLVEEHVVADRRRHLHEPVVQRNSASARAGSPTRSLISDRQPRHRQPMCARERMESRPELLASKRSQIGFNTAPKIVVVTAVQGLVRSPYRTARRPLASAQTCIVTSSPRSIMVAPSVQAGVTLAARTRARSDATHAV